jgi:RPM1-interacting protein 4
LEGLSKDTPSAKASPLRTGLDPMVQKPKDERRANREDELRRQEATARKPYAQSPNHRYGDNAARKNGVERSPLHPRQQARVSNRGVSSPSWERRGSSEGNRGTAPTTPGRSKMRSSGHGDETV